MFMKSVLSGKISLILVIIQRFFDETNKNVIGKMKDKFGGVIVVEFVGLKSNMHSIKLMVKNVIQQKDGASQLSLINSKMFYLMKKVLDTK